MAVIRDVHQRDGRCWVISVLAFVQAVCGCRLGYEASGTSASMAGAGGGAGLGSAAGGSSAGGVSGGNGASSAGGSASSGSSDSGGAGGSATGGTPSLAGAGGEGGAPAPPCGGCPAGEVCVEDTCGVAKRVFVTSVMSDAAFGGVQGGDDRCQAAADSSALGGTWLAWLSDGVTSPSARFAQSAVPYVLLTGTLVANDWADLVDGTLAHAIDRDEALREVVLREVWTGTTASGTPTGNDCNGWKSKVSNALRAEQGLTSESGSGWTNVYLQFCDRNNVSLYCFEQ